MVTRKQEYMKEYFQKNKKARSAYQKEYYASNKKRLLDRQHEYYELHKEHHKKVASVYQKSHRELCRASNKKYHQKIKGECFDHYGWKCACPKCPETNPEFLTIDHINGGGNEHRRQINHGGSQGGHSLYQWLRNNNFPEGFQALCYNCNCGRAKSGGICPHLTHST